MTRIAPSTLERVREMTRQGLEREAERLLTLDKVRQRISDAAMEGYHKVAITPEKPLDLARTETAKATVAALKTEGFSVEWEARVQTDGHPWFTMVVAWL